MKKVFKAIGNVIAAPFVAVYDWFVFLAILWDEAKREDEHR